MMSHNSWPACCGSTGAVWKNSTSFCMAFSRARAGEALRLSRQCFMDWISSMFTVPRFRKTAMTMARPTAASAAATAMMKNGEM